MSKKTIYVTGHKNPDTDSIISAMAYAYLKQQLGYDAIAVRLGELNQETEYVLNLFNEFAPPVAKDIYTRIRDIEIDDVVTCRPNDNLKVAMDLMAKHDKRVIVVTDNRRHLVGIATIPDITRPIITNNIRKDELLVQASIQSIINLIDGEAVMLFDGPHSNGRVHVMNSVIDDDVVNKIVICPADDRMQKAAIRNGAKTLICCKMDYFGEETLNLAEEKKCNLIISPLSMYTVMKEIDFAIPISAVMTTNLTTFKFDERLNDIKTKIVESRFRCYPVLDTYDHVIGTISRFHVFRHANRSLILVDHNELSQSIDGADEADILEIIDHHRIGGIKTGSPVFFRNEQLGCCATIVTKIFEENGVEIPEDLAGLLCCAIISDTVNFQSVTCTKQDRMIAEKLAAISKLDVEKTAKEMLEAGAMITNKTTYAILHNDLKGFDIDKFKVKIGQCNIIDFDAIRSLRERMQKEISDYSKRHNCDICLMVFSLIDGSGSYVLFAGRDTRIVVPALQKMGTYEDGFIFLPKVMSRKLQIVPALTEEAKILERG